MKRRIPWFLIIMVLSTALLIGTFFDYFNTNRSKMNQVSDQYIQEIVEQYAQMVDVKSEESVKNLQNVTKQIVNQKGLSQKTIKKILNQAAPASSFDYYRMIHKNGISEYGDNAVNVKDRDYYKALLRGESGISKPVMSRYLGKKVLVIYTPVSYENQDILGIAGVYELDGLLKRFESDTFSKNASYNIVDKEANIIIGNELNEKELLKEATFKARKAGKINEMTDKGEVYGYYSPIKVNDWSVYVRLSSEITASMSIPFRNTAILFIVKAIIALGAITLALVFREKKRRHATEEINRELSLSNQSFHIAINKMDGEMFTIDLLKNMIHFENVRDNSVYTTFSRDLYIPDDLFREEIVHPDSFGVITKAYEQLKKGKMVSGVQFQIKTTTGRYSWVNLIVNLVYDEAGRAIRGLGVLEDISQKKIMEGRLKHEMTECHDKADSHRAILVYNLTREKAIEYWENGKLLDKYVYGNLFGLYLSRIDSSYQEQLNKYFRADKLIRRFDKGEYTIHFDSRVKESFGGGWESYDIHLLQEPETSEVWMYLYIDDITDEREAEEKSKLEKQRYDRTLELLGQSYYVVYEVNLETNQYDLVFSRNQKGSMGTHGIYDVDYSKYVELYVAPEEQERMREIFGLEALRKRIRENNINFSEEYRQVVENDGYRWTGVEVVFIPQTRESCILVAFRDINQDKIEELESREILNNALLSAKEANEAKSEFLARMSHDIRTPMNGIIGMTEIARMNVENSEKLTDALSKIDTSSHFLLTLINDVLDMTRIESGKMDIQKEQTDIKQLFRQLTAIVETQAKSRNMTFSIDCAPDVEDFYKTDELRLNQILMNLISNSLKYAGENKNIDLIVRKLSKKEKSDLLQFEVIDDGKGMEESFVSRIFNPFEQEHSNSFGELKGTGLGMSIVKQLVELLDGSIVVESKINSGTKVIVTLELERVLQTRELPLTEEDVRKYKFHGERILLVEDNEINCEITQTFLELNSLKVDIAKDGRQAYTMFADSEPGYYKAILMDIQMPVMNGYEATKAIRGLERDDAKKVPILALSANAFREDIQKSLNAGMNAHLAKPIDVKEVKLSLKEFLETT